jgi:hypothetical protein
MHDNHDDPLNGQAEQQAIADPWSEALLPFAEPKAAEKAGFDATKPYTFVPFTPTLPNPLGEFHSLKG